MVKARTELIYSSKGAMKAAREATKVSTGMRGVRGAAPALGAAAVGFSSMGVAAATAAPSILGLGAAVAAATGGISILTAAIAALIGGTVSGLTGLIAKSVGAASNLENFEVRLTTLFGSAKEAKAALAQFFEFEKRTPFVIGEIVEAATVLQAMTGRSRELIEVTGDLAGLMGVDLPFAASAFGRAFAAGSGAADIFRERGILNIIRASTGIQDIEKLTLPRFREAMLQAFTDPDGSVVGGADRLSRTLFGKFSILIGRFARIFIKAGNFILPLLKRIIDAITLGLDDKTILNVVAAFKSMIPVLTGVAKILAAMGLLVANFVSVVANFVTLRFLDSLKAVSETFPTGVRAAGLIASGTADIAIGASEFTAAAATLSGDADRILNKIADAAEKTAENTDTQARGMERSRLVRRPAQPLRRE